MISCIIPARMSSSRFPGKPLHKILGKELILRMCEIAGECKNINQVIVATEDKEIRDLVTYHGFKCMMTGKFSTCTHRVSEVVRQLTDKPDYIVNLQGDEPCLKSYMIDEMIDVIVQNKHNMIQAIYDITRQDMEDDDCVKAVINNGTVTHLTRTPEMYTNNLKGIAGLYVYDYQTIANFSTYDLRLVEAWQGLDTFGFIGKIPVVPYKLPYRTHAVDRPTDISIVEAKLS